MSFKFIHVFFLSATMLFTMPALADDDHGGDDHGSSSSSSSSSSGGSSGGGSSSNDNRYQYEREAARVDRSPSYRAEYSSSKLSSLKTLRAKHLTDKSKEFLFSFEVTEKNRSEALSEITNHLESKGFVAAPVGSAQSMILEQLN